MPICGMINLADLNNFREVEVSDKAPTTGSISGYRSVLWHDDENFYLEIPQFSIRVKDTDLPAAYGKLQVSLDAMIKEYDDAGAEAPPPTEIQAESAGASGGIISRRKPATDRSASISFGDEIRLFLIKSAIAGVMIGVVMVFSLNYAINSAVSSTIGNTISSIPKILSRKLATYTYIGMHNVAERIRNATPEEREGLREDLRLFARELKPFIDEISPPPNPASSESQ